MYKGLENMKRGISSRLYQAMKQDIAKGMVSPRGILGTGWRRIPAVSKFDVKESETNQLLAAVGIQRKLPREVEYATNANKDMNRYMSHVIRRFKKNLEAGNLRKCWAIILWNMQHSVSFRLSAFIRVYPDWWKSMTICEIIRIQKEVERIISTWDSELQFHRAYISKDETRWRPLGVPSKEWRVVMHMWANWLTMYFQRDVQKFNHAYTPGHGTVTAWKEVIEKVLKKPYIYEFDLKSFFDNVKINLVRDKLWERLVPDKVIEWFNQVHRMEPKFPRELKMVEPILESRRKLNKVKEAMSDSMQAFWDIVEETEKEKGGPEKFLEYIKKETVYSTREDWAFGQFVALKRAAKDFRDDEAYYEKVLGKTINPKARQVLRSFAIQKVTRTGLPQGLNTSPILSILTLKDWWQELKEQNINLSMYADDGLIYSDISFDVNSEEETSTINPDKSRWLKKDGVWLVENFQYLGLNYNVKSGSLSAHTRKGSRLEFGADQENLFTLLKELSNHGDKYSTIQSAPKLELLSRSALLGTVMARLYEGNWNIIDYPEKKSRVSQMSWLKMVGKKQIKGLKPNLRSSTPVGYLRMLTETIMRAPKTVKVKEKGFGRIA